MVTSRKVKEIYNEISVSLSRMGSNNPREGERQSLYGDILDWLKDNHGELVNNDYDDDFVAKYIVGMYVIKNKLINN